MGKDLYASFVVGVPCSPQTKPGKFCGVFTTDVWEASEAIFGKNISYPQDLDANAYGLRHEGEVYVGRLGGGGIKNISFLMPDPGYQEIVEEEATPLGLWVPHLFGTFLVVRTNE